MMKLRKRQLAGVVCLAMMMGMTACGKTADDTSGQEVTTEVVTESVEVVNDAMDIHSEDNAEFYAIRIKDEYYEIYQEGDYVGFRNLYLDQQGTYPPLEEGKVGKVIADVDIYNGGEGGYSNEKFIKEINEFEEISYSKFVSAFDICDASNAIYNSEHPFLKYQEMEDIYILFPDGHNAVVYKNGERFMEYNNENYTSQEYPVEFFEYLEEVKEAEKATASDAEGMMLGDISLIEETEETSDSSETSEDGPQNASGIGPGSGSSSAKKSDKIDYVEVDGYKQITQDTAQTLMANNSDYIILDVREDTEYYDGHIPGAINISNTGIADKELSELPDKDQMILVYCRSGRRSKDAARKLAKIGYTNVYEFGGINDWTGDITME